MRFNRQRPQLMTAGAILLAFSACVGVPSDVEGGLRPSEAVVQRARWDGRRVTLVGYLVSEFENRGIWDDKASYRKHESEARCVGLLIRGNMTKAVDEFSGRYAVVTGTLDQDTRRRPELFMGQCNFVAVDIIDVHPLPR